MHLLLLLHLHGRVTVCSAYRHLLLLLSARNQIQASVVLEVVRVIITYLLADWLLCHLVDILKVADVDGTVDQEQVNQLAVILLDDLCEESVGICVGTFFKQVFRDGIVVLRAKLYVP